MKSLNTPRRLVVSFCGVFMGMACVFLLPQAAFLLFGHQNPGVPLPDSYYNTDSATVISCSLPVYYILGACLGSALPLFIFRKWSSAAKFLAWSGVLMTATLLILFAIHIYPPMGRPTDGSVAPVNFGTPAFLLALVNLFCGVVLQLATGQPAIPASTELPGKSTELQPETLVPSGNNDPAQAEVKPGTDGSAAVPESESGIE